jgi:GR25 family glycosyltransferase involved in LPS biosynthesis
MTNKIKKLILIFLLIFFLIINNKKEYFSNNTNPINIYFDSVNVITVPKRKNYMVNVMNKLEINANIVDATLVKNIDYNELLNNNFTSDNYYSIENKGRIACHLSQITLLKKFIQSDDDTIFIFEDDISNNISKDYKNIIEDSMSNIPDDWDIVFFGRCWDDCNNMKKIKNTNNLYQVFSPLCRHAYGLTKKGAKKILQYTIPMTDNGDQMYKKHINNGNITAYAIHPSLFSQNRNDFGSNIGNDINKIFQKAASLFNKDIRKSVYPPTCKI